MASETELFDLEQSLANLNLEEVEYNDEDQCFEYDYYESVFKYKYECDYYSYDEEYEYVANHNLEEEKYEDKEEEEEYDYDCDYVEYDYGDEEEGKWLTYYSSEHKILLVGEGDFSFSLCLAQAFGSASNIYATSLDSEGELLMKYSCVWANLHRLKIFGAYVDHGVDVGSMLSHGELSPHRFDRIIFNFPHAGFKKSETHPLQIAKHRKLVDKFFFNASRMLLPDGEIHINHKTSYPYSEWNINDLACENNLRLIECIDFEIEAYPGYENKRGAGSWSDYSFNLGCCCTFKYSLYESE